MAKKTNTQGECTLCHAKMDRAEFPAHIAEGHKNKDHASGIINESNMDDYFRVPPPPPKVKNVAITPEEHAIVRRLKKALPVAHRVDKSGCLDEEAFTFGFFIGAGVEPKRAHEFNLLCYSGWLGDPVFSKDLPKAG